MHLEIHRAMSGGWNLPADVQDKTSDRDLPEFPFGRSVLIVEDNWLISIEWQAALEAAGYEVLGPAVSADEAFAISDAQRPAFILMDIRLLGNGDGVDAAILMRSRMNIPSIFVSAHDDKATRDRAAAAQPLGWITKPVLAARLPELIRQMKRAIS